MWSFIQILLIIVLIMGIILLAKPLYARLGRPRIHFPKTFKGKLLYSVLGILGLIVIISSIAAIVSSQSSHPPYTLP